MRILLSSLTCLFTSTLAIAQPGKPPDQLLPADAVAYFRYDGYAAHRKAYDQTALAQAMKEGLGGFLDHLFTQLLTNTGDDVPPRNLKKGEGRRKAVDHFLSYIWDHGFHATIELRPPNKERLDKEQGNIENPLQLCFVFPNGADKKNRSALDNFLRFFARALEVDVQDANIDGRAGHFFLSGDTNFTWWPEGKHVVFAIGAHPAKESLRVIDGRRPNVESTRWHANLAGFKGYETDMRGYVNLAAIVDRLANLGLEERSLATYKERVTRNIILAHLGLRGIKDLTFHLGFDGKYQRSTVRLGVVETEKRGGLLQFAAGPITFETAKLPPLPPDADYVSVRHVDWPGMYDYIRSTYVLASLSRLLGGEMPEAFPDLDKILGIEFRKDFLTQLDTNVVTWGAHSEGPFFLGQGFAVKVKDVPRMRKSLQAITKALGQNETFKVEKLLYRGQELNIFSKSPIPVTFCLSNDWLVFGLFPQTVQGVVMRGSGKYRVWKAPPEIDVAFAKKGNGKSKLIAMSVSDPRPAVAIGLSLMPLFAQSLNASGAKWLNVGEVPNSQSINEWLFPNVMLSYDDGDALRWENLYSMNEPDDLLVSPMLAQFFALVPLSLPGRRWNAVPLPQLDMMPAPRKVLLEELPKPREVPKY